MTRRPLVLSAVNQSLAAADWLTPADEAMATAARNMAYSIDAAYADDEATAPQVIGYLWPHLANVLRSLGCSPESRKKLALSPSKPVGRLAELRAAQDAKNAGKPAYPGLGA